MKIIIFMLVLILLFSSTAFGETISVTIGGAVGKLSAVIQKPKGDKMPMVMMFHGFISNKNFELLTALADALEAHGIASIRFDFNGHGDSEGDLINMTVLNEIDDARHVYNYVKALPYVDSISIAGHSQGGVVASMIAGELGAEVIKKLVLFAPAAVLRDDMLRGNFFGVNFDAANPPETVETIDGPKIGRNYILTAQTLPIYETAEKFTGPVCMIHGTADIVVPYTYSLSYKRVYANSELHLIDGVDHSFRNSWNEAAKIAADFLNK